MIGNQQAFAQVTRAAILDPTLTHAQFRLLAILALHRHWRTGWSWPRPAQLAASMGMTGKNSSDTIADMIKVLAARGWIEYRPGRGKRPSLYRVNLDSLPPTDAEVDADIQESLGLKLAEEGSAGMAEPEGGAQPDTDDDDFPLPLHPGNALKGGFSPPGIGGVQPPIIRGGSAPPSYERDNGTRQRNETIHGRAAAQPEKRKGRVAAPGEPEGFAEWYAAYPRKVKRPTAAKAFAAACRKTTQKVLMQAVGAFAAAALEAIADGRRDMSTIPHPASWLNGEAWGDDTAHVFGTRNNTARQNGRKSRNGGVALLRNGG